MRIALGIEYDGAPFCGWQRQNGVATVQESLERALSKVADRPVAVTCAGRTDTGVHALGQVVHFDTEVERSPRSWVFGANANLPKSVSVTWAQTVAEDFQARFSARRRCYRYIIHNRPVRPTFLQWRVAWEYRPLEETRMQAGAAHLVGEHDFSSYRALACQAKSPVRTVHRLEVSRQDDLVFIDIEANAFLHHMVRNVAGVLMTIGAGEQGTDWSREVLEHRDRTLGGVTAPAHGLYLMEVEYAPQFDLPRLPPTSAVW